MPTCVAPQSSRNWLGYLCESQMSNGSMPSWEAAAYFTDNLFGEAPNPRLHESKSPYESISLFLQRVYNPIVEAATRAVDLPASSMIHVFTDISLIGNSAVLVVYFPGENRPHQLLLLDAARAWDLVFPDADAFNAWAEERYNWIISALQSAVARQMAEPEIEAATASV
ncbi:MAG: hypothetical protein EPO61_07890 [Nitrospirae bacterium]|nr:MAG: hypothetical protein EPO61_07890 [Nitrospirota bacterium]